MIKSYRDKKTQRFADGSRVKQFEAFRRQAERRLELLDAAESVQDLAALRSNHFEALKGDRQHQFSIRINLQWRICFEWPKEAGGPENVEIVDYH